MNKVAIIIAFVAALPAIASPPYAYVLNGPSVNGATGQFPPGSVFVVNFKTNQVVATIGVGEQATSIAANPNGKFVYVTNAGDSTISVIDASTNTVAQTVAIGNGFGNPSLVLVSPDGKLLYLSNSGTSVVSATDFKILASISGTSPLLLSPDGKFLYGISGNTLQKISTSTLKVVASQTIQNQLIAQAVSNDGESLFLLTGQAGEFGPVNETLLCLSTASLAIDAQFPLAGSFAALAISPDSKEVFLTSDHPDLSIVDTSTGKELKHIYLPIGGGAIAVSPHGRFILVAGDPNLAGNVLTSTVCGIAHIIIGEVFGSFTGFSYAPPGVAFFPSAEDD